MNPTPIERLFAEFPPTTDGEWRKVAEESLHGAPFEKKLVTRTPEGIDLQPIYTRADLEKLSLGESWPGLAPYARGADPLGARTAGWLICQEVLAARPEAFNAALLHDLSRGQNAVNLPLDAATRAGLDPDQAAPADLGHGLSLAVLDDACRALRGVNLAAVPLYAPAGNAALPLVALLTAWLAEQGQPPAALHGAVFADPVAEWAARGTLPGGWNKACDLMAQLTRWAGAAQTPLQTIGVQANLWADAGGSAVQELAFGLATGVDYLRALEARRVPVEQAAPRCLFTYALGSHLFMEIAKLRAARLLWARAVGAAGGSAAAQRLVCHGRTARWNKTVLDPHVNLLRTTSEAFAGVVGGCASIHVGPFDECFRAPDDFSRRLARNLQIILAEECQLGRVVDPAGGSYYVETLTGQLAAKAWMLFQEVEKRGGMAAALRAGFPQDAVAKTAADRLAAAEGRRDGIIGTNLHPNLREEIPAVTPVTDPAFAGARAKEIAEFKKPDGETRGNDVLTRIARWSGADVAMESLQEAFAYGATLGEVAQVLRAGGSDEPAIKTVRPRRRSEAFEALRFRAEAFRARTGARPKVFLASLGPRKQHGARADFSAGFFAAGGFEVVPNQGFDTPAAAAAAALASAAPIVVICSTDDTHPALVPPLAQALKAAPRPPAVVLAGLPAAPELQQQFKAAGVDEFIHVRANCAQMLASFQDQLGL